MIVNHDEKISFKMQFIIKTLSFVKRLTKITLWRLSINAKQVFVIPKKKYQSKNYQIKGINVIEFNAGKKDAIFYFHGGGFVLKGRGNHYRFAHLLSRKAGMTLYYIDYPLAPVNKADTVIEKTRLVVDELVKINKHEEYHFLGDSAGGNIALVLLKKIDYIKQTIILSPWVDLSMSTDIPNSLEKAEFMFTKKQLLDAAISYIGDRSLSDEFVCPVNGLFEDYPITIFAGKSDILFPDIFRFVEKNQNIVLYQYEGLPHDFMFISNTKEEMMIVNEISNILSPGVNHV